ncbi:MTH1187 family thiamine-binding protein [Archaeoglobus neptunius]|uniref:MTH1187 family thiamine-binding protein n=1 Tax=Archaeoglobus neptunius TaxID=2798580 RepID=UPI0019256034|nr:MTH1187 family thiamine-binding protein [Archaeoglobus neptunius]
MIVEISVVPIGVGESLSRYIAVAIQVLSKMGLKFELNPMGTVFEVGDFQKLAEVLEEIDRSLFESGSPRNYFVVKIDHRKKGGKMEDKVRSVIQKTK